MRIPIALSAITLATCTIAPQGDTTPDEASASHRALYAGEERNAPATNDAIVCPGEFPDSAGMENPYEGVPEFFCD